MDGLNELFISILSLSISGVSIGAIIADVIYCVKSVKKIHDSVKSNSKDIQVTKTEIEQAFKDAVLPKTIKLDVSSKIEKPIKEGMEKIKEINVETLNKLHEENVMILKILSQFTHIKKLSDDDQEKIADIVNEEASEEITL